MGAIDTVRDVRSPPWLRGLNVLLGCWLFVAAFLPDHRGNVGFNDWIVGMVVAASAVSAIWAPPFRWVNVGAGVWLGFGAVLLEYRTPIARLHDLAVAGAVVVIALVRWHTAPAGEPVAE